MNRAASRYLQKPRSLFVTQRSRQLYVTIYPRYVTVFRFTVGAIVGVYARLTELHFDSLERKSLPSRVHLERHRRAGAEPCQQKIIGTRSGVRATRFDWFVGDERVIPCRNDLFQVIVGCYDDF